MSKQEKSLWTQFDWWSAFVKLDMIVTKVFLRSFHNLVLIRRVLWMYGAEWLS